MVISFKSRTVLTRVIVWRHRCLPHPLITASLCATLCISAQLMQQPVLPGVGRLGTLPGLVAGGDVDETGEREDSE